MHAALLPSSIQQSCKYYHFLLDPKLGHIKFSIRRIPCACISYTNILDNPWSYGAYPTKQPCYQPVEYYTYLPVLGSLDNWNVIHFTNKTTSSGDFDAVYKVVISSISDYMPSLLKLVKYGAINAADPTTMGYCVVK